MVPIHPIVVHFPVVLLLTALLAYAWSWARNKQNAWEIALLLHAGGVLSCVAAILSGNAAEKSLEGTDELYTLVSLHEKLGMMSAWAFGLLAAWSFLRKEAAARLERGAFLLLFTCVIGVLAFTSHLGGRMVFEQGAGVNRELFQNHP